MIEERTPVRFERPVPEQPFCPARRDRGLRVSSLATLIVLCTWSASAQEQSATLPPPQWSPALSMEYRAVSSTVLSPDGSQVAFVVREPVMEGEDSEYRSQIWVASADGSGARQYTHGEVSASAPAFSPDGEWLTFLSKRGKGEEVHTQVWGLRLAGGEAQALTASDNDVSSFAFSPGGDRIAYLRTDPLTEEEETAKKEKRDVIVVGQDYHYAHLFVVPFAPATREVGEAIRLTEGERHLTAFDWSPDGAQLVYRHQSDPTLNTGMIGGDLAVVAAQGGAARELVDWPGDDSDPHWTPDGRSVLFVSHGGSIEAVGLGDLYVVPAQGGTPRALAHTPDRSASVVGFLGDDEALVTEAYRTTRALFRVSLDGDSVERWSGEKGVISSASVSLDRSAVAFTFEDSETPEDVFVSGPETFSSTRVSDLHAEIDRPAMALTERITWRSADGLEIEGLLTLPAGHRSGERMPLVLNIHGGPAGVFSESFTGAPAIYMLQTFAERGYAVLRPNPRGSTAYGKDFRYANVRDWCFGDYDDVMSGVDALIEQGIVDPERLFVMGWSYGGYMTSCVISRTDRFAAASMGAGLPNLVSMVHTTDIPDYVVAHLGGKELWEDYAEYERHSAMYRLGEIVTPTQIIHGAEDLRVPFSQGQELYVGLERLGVPTEMVVYPRTPHGPREPKFLMDVTGRILDWFGRHGGPTVREEKAASPSTGSGR